jgi:hypothetical protein
MITLLETLIDGADGAYATTRDMRKLEHVMSTWNERKDTYLAVQAKEQVIIERTIAAMQDSQMFQEQAMNDYGLDRCRRDLTLGLRSYALAMLLQDEEMLKDRTIYWQKNILQAMGLQQYKGYKVLLESVYAELPKAQADLMMPFVKIAQDAIAFN